MTYDNLNDEQASAQRMADRGDAWDWCDLAQSPPPLEGESELARLLAVAVGVAADNLRQALHDRDMFQRERDYWLERWLFDQGFTEECR